LSQIFVPSQGFSPTIRITSSSKEKPVEFGLGEVLEGKVIEEIDDHHAVLQANGHDFRVESTLRLSANMKGYFRVEATQPQVTLKLLQQEEGEKGEIESLLKRFFSLNFIGEDLAETENLSAKIQAEALPLPIRQTFEQWLSFLKGLSWTPPYSPDPDRIGQIIAQSGLFLENKLRFFVDHPSKDAGDRILQEDMKALLLKLKSQMISLPVRDRPPGADPLGLDKLLRKVEGYQILNLLPATSQEKVFLLLPFWFQDHLQLVEMNLSLPRSKSKPREEEEHSILFLLQLPQWGRMNIEVKMKGKALYSCFKVCSPEASSFLRNGLVALEKNLNRAGFQAHLSVSLETPRKMPETLLADLEREAESFFNIVI